MRVPRPRYVELLFLFLLFAVSLPPLVSAQPSQRLPKELHFGPITLVFPQHWHSTPHTKNPLILTSRPENQDYPNLNLLHLPGTYSFEKADSVLFEELIASYKQNGFIDATLVAGTRSTLQEKTLILARIHYSLAGTPFESELFIVNGIDEHYIGTLTQKRASTRSLSIVDFLKSFTDTEAFKQGQSDLKQSMVIIVVLLVILGVVLCRTLYTRPT